MKRLSRMAATAICFLVLLSGCGTADSPSPPLGNNMTPAEPSAALGEVTPALEISQITTLEPGFSSASFSGNDSFQVFLTQGGASSDI